MKRIFTLILALSLLALTACSGGGTGETDSLTPEERTQRFVTAITDARSEEDNEYNSILSSADDDTADMTFQLLGVTTEDMESFAISVSLMNVKAYGIAVIKPAQDSEDTVKEGLQGFIDQQQQNFQMYLPDQYEVAKNARLETLEDGTVTIRHRDTMAQERVKIESLHAMVDEECSYRKLFRKLNL